MRIFFDKFAVSKKIEAISYIIYFIAITFIYFTVSIPAIMIASNLALFFMLTFNYESTLKQKLGAVVLIYITLMTIESLIVLFSNYYSLSMTINGSYSSVFGIIAIRILSFAVVIIIGNFKNIKLGKSISISYWFCIAFIPFSSLVLLIIFFNFPVITRNQALIVTTIIFAINFSSFYIYDTISRHTNNRLKEILLERQNNYYNQQFELMKVSISSMNTLKHDLKNHLSAIYTLLNGGDIIQAKDHISDMMSVCEFDKKHANSGNISIDSILNFKLNESVKNGIDVSLDLSVPLQIDIPSFDMAIILGNLLDNAIRANQTISQNRYINVTVRFDKGRLLIKIENPYDGVLIEQNGKFLTTKLDKSNHGLGMDSINNTLKKYNGILNCDYSENVFKAQILMYID